MCVCVFLTKMVYKNGRVRTYFKIFHRCYHIAANNPPQPLQHQSLLPQQPLHQYHAHNTYFYFVTPVAPPCSTTIAAEQNPRGHHYLD